MKFLCCFSSPELTAPLPPVEPSAEQRNHGAGTTAYPQVQSTQSSTYIMPDVKVASDPLAQQSSELTNTKVSHEIHAPDRSRDKTSMSSPHEAHDSDEELRTTGKSATQWKEEEREKSSSQQHPAPVAGEEWRRWKENPANKDYTILNTLGRGAFADVILGRHRATNKHHALKVVYLNKPGLKDKHIAVLQREGTYLRKLQHKNIVRCLKVYQAPQQWVFVLEYLKGGMLLNDLAKLKRYSEKTAAAVFRQVLSAVSYLHENNIVHRDIKPENVVFKHSVSNIAAFGKDNIVKLVDFGMILDLSKEPNSRGMMGSPGFVAPEVILGQHHTSQMDNYSMGVLLFVMLVGAKPMTQEQARSMQYALMTPESLRGMHDPRWRALTDSAKDLILKLLQPDPKNRYTAKQALNHRWIKGAREDSILDGSVMEGWADHVQMMQHAYMGTPSPFGNYAGPQAFNMRNGLMSPHPPNFHPPASGAQTTGASRSGVNASTSSMRSRTPVSPLAGHRSNSGYPSANGFPAEQGSSRTPTWTAHGTPNAEQGNSPFAWTPGENTQSAPLSAPLSQQFADVAHKAVHDEVMKHAHEKLVQAQRYFMAAQVMRQADNSGRLPASLSGSGVPQSPSMAPPPMSPKQGRGISGGLGTDGSEVTQWASRTHDNSLSAVAQSYMSTQNTSGVCGTPKNGGSGQNGSHRLGPQKGNEFDAVVKDAKNLMNELNKAPALAGLEEAPKTAAEQQAFDMAIDMINAEQQHQSGSQSYGQRSRRRVKSSSNASGTGGTRSAAAGGAQQASTHTPRASSKSRRSSRSSHYENMPLPRSILEQPIADPARDAYYGGVAMDDDNGSSASGPTGLRSKKGGEQSRPSSRKTEGLRSTGKESGPRSTRSRKGGSNRPRSSQASGRRGPRSNQSSVVVEL